MNPKPRILMLASNTPQMVGSGSPVRTYHFAKALAAFGELSLAVFSSDGQREIPRELQDSCRRVIRAKRAQGPSPNGYHHSRRRQWMTALQVVAAPWRNDWTDLLRYALGLCGDADADRAAPKTRRALAVFLQLELSVAARCSQPPSMVTFCQHDAFLSIRDELLALTGREDFDLLWFDHSFNYPYAEDLLTGKTRPLVVCNTHNIEFRLAEALARVPAGGRSAAWWRIQSRILKRLESRAFGRSNLVLACSEEDRNLALGIAPAANVVVVGNGVDTAHFQPSAGHVRAPIPTLLFTGLFEYGPNTDAVKYFVSEILPLIRERVPECRFVFAGRGAQAAFDALGLRNHCSVSCVSDPPDMRPEFERAWVFVVPLRVGGGTRLKILESMAMECPVVSTTIGAQGVPYVNGEHLLLADTPRQFADGVLRMLTDADLRTLVAVRAANWVRERYDWAGLCAQAIEALGELSFRSPHTDWARQRVTRSESVDDTGVLVKS